MIGNILAFAAIIFTIVVAAYFAKGLAAALWSSWKEDWTDERARRRSRKAKKE